MANHPIEALMKTTMESLKDMVDVNTIVGDPVETPDGTVIIPISRVSFGFASGGGEYNIKINNQEEDADTSDKLPFAGGTGAGVSVQPVAFMVVGNGEMKLLPVDQNATMLDNLINFMPKLLDKIQSMGDKKNQSKSKKNSEDKLAEE
ncbi:sporulation protein YtfJ [Crassaminicella thermophila]|uniref:Sporulation protein YtfJ n=1 Tax=Crassaminicella thermophila TaxID=2599308 RepID=A0A5C0SEN3_CRATE|nr:GerW family sporulation protein [Crassaminicella thermophila]QEK12197.1 sporulation protein YtfJ [Crassaminicella thermophila]